MAAVKNNNPILAEQLAYYRARAREYDKWFRREGLHDLGEEHNARWRLELNRVYSALDAFAPRGDVLELAYGTGEWTIRLAESATRVVGVDAAPEMRELALAKLQDAGKSNVELWVDDLFSWQPDQDYDVVFFAFGFRTFPRAIPTGFGAASTTRFAPEAASSSWMPQARSWTGTSFTVRDCPIARARLSSGDSRTVGRIRIFKRSFDPDRLARDLRDHGLDASFVETGEFFVVLRTRPTCLARPGTTHAEPVCKQDIRPASTVVTPGLPCVADLLAEGERMPVYVHVSDHPDARVLA